MTPVSVYFKHSYGDRTMYRSFKFYNCSAGQRQTTNAYTFFNNAWFTYVET